MLCSEWAKYPMCPRQEPIVVAVTCPWAKGKEVEGEEGGSGDILCWGCNNLDLCLRVKI